MDPRAMDVLADALLTGDMSGAIERQEARGQRDLVASTRLPKECHGQEALEKAGVVFGEPVDRLFVAVTLPLGWKLAPTDHAMWSKLRDEQGRERASVFYKAAFYDEKASMSATARFSAHKEPVGGWGKAPANGACYVGVVTDCGEEIWRSEPTEPEPEEREARLAWYATEEEREKLACAWLDEHWPEWRDAGAYW